MFKMKLLRNTNGMKNPYIYKWSFECFGRGIEFGLSVKEFSTIKGKTRTFFQAAPKAHGYWHSVKKKIEKQRNVIGTDSQRPDGKKHVEKKVSSL